MSEPSRWDRIFHGAIAVVLLCLFTYIALRVVESGQFDFSQVFTHFKLLLIPFAMILAVGAANRRRSESPEEETEQEIEDL
jgi:hypothetical protein